MGHIARKRQPRELRREQETDGQANVPSVSLSVVLLQVRPNPPSFGAGGSVTASSGNVKVQVGKFSASRIACELTLSENTKTPPEIRPFIDRDRI